MLNLVQVTDPYFASELDFHRERISDELAEAEMRRRAKTHGQRRNAPRTA